MFHDVVEEEISLRDTGLDLRSRPNDKIDGKGAGIKSGGSFKQNLLTSLSRTLFNHEQEVHVAVFSRLSISVGAEENHLFRMDF